MQANIMIGLLGAGNMSEAIMKGLLQSGINPQQIICSDISESRLQYIREHLKVQTSKDNQDIVKKAEVLIIAVKPNVVVSLLENLNPLLTSDKLIISIAAGINIATIEIPLRWSRKAFPLWQKEIILRRNNLSLQRNY
jgi:pyrroline-5-carboxylate reductase